MDKIDGNYRYPRYVIRISEDGPALPKQRTLADEKLSQALKRAVNSVAVPPGLEGTVRSMIRDRVQGNAE